MLYLALCGAACSVMGTLSFHLYHYRRWTLCAHKHWHIVDVAPEVSSAVSLYWTICTRYGTHLAEHQYAWKDNV